MAYPKVTHPTMTIGSLAQGPFYEGLCHCALLPFAEKVIDIGPVRLHSSGLVPENEIWVSGPKGPVILRLYSEDSDDHDS
jgi:hypothetical protein